MDNKIKDLRKESYFKHLYSVFHGNGKVQRSVIAISVFRKRGKSMLLQISRFSFADLPFNVKDCTSAL